MQDFVTFFSERVREKGLTLRRLSELSGIALKHLEALERGDAAKLPPAPYLRAYLIRIGKILDFDGEAYWKFLSESGLTSTSGPEDQLPKNRFAQKPLGRALWGGVFILLVLGYVGIRYSSIFGKPILVLRHPEGEWSTSREDRVIVRGAVTHGDRLFINGEEVRLTRDGGFEKIILLDPGLNTIEIAATKFLGKETRTFRRVVYEAMPPTSPADATSTIP